MGAITFRWTDEACALIADMWLAHSAAEIRDALQARFEGAEKLSRNSILGKAMRLGLACKTKHSRDGDKRRRSPGQPVKPRKRVLHPRDGAAPPKASAPRAYKPIIRPLAPVDPIAPPLHIPGQPVGLAALTRSSCRYPMEDPTGDACWAFCGQTTAADGQSYCAHHYLLCYEPRRQDKRRPEFIKPAKASKWILEEA